MGAPTWVKVRVFEISRAILGTFSLSHSVISGDYAFFLSSAFQIEEGDSEILEGRGCPLFWLSLLI